MMLPSTAAAREIPRGLGEYPGYYCYDATRPSWLPYWLDSLTESKCKWSPSTIAGNIYAAVTDAPDYGEPSEEAKDPTKSGPGVAPAGEPTNVPRCSRFESFNPTTTACEFNPLSPSFLVLAGLGIATLAFWPTRRR